MNEVSDLIIVGAGPFGLSMSAYCRHENINFTTIGKHMEFWKENMPNGMFLRSGFDWHLDPFNEQTFEKYLDIYGLNKKELTPVPLKTYLDYTRWFTGQKDIEIRENYVSSLDHNSDNNLFEVLLDDGVKLDSKNVLLAIGFRYFKNLPSEIEELIPGEKIFHTSDIKDFEVFRGKRCLIVGGRMSAFESAALLKEAGCDQVYLSYRHDTPEFTESDWDWVMPMLDKIVDDPEWYLNMDESEKKRINERFYKEGRLKMEPWLEERLNNEKISFFPNSEITGCSEMKDGGLKIKLGNQESINVDDVILATGYKVDMKKLPFLRKGNVLEKLSLDNGFPCLDENLQTNIPGLFVTSMAATKEFGSFFGFTVSVNASSKIIGRYIKQRLNKN